MGMGSGNGQGRGNPRDAWRREREAEEAAAKAREREHRLLADLRDTPEAEAAWEAARAKIAASVPDSTFKLWLEPLRCRGESKGALYLVAPDGIQPWVERRYGPFIGKLVRDASEFRGVFMMPVPEGERSEEGDGCL